jgi:hypothetical protein
LTLATPSARRRNAPRYFVLLNLTSAEHTRKVNDGLQLPLGISSRLVQVQRRSHGMDDKQEGQFGWFAGSMLVLGATLTVIWVAVIAWSLAGIVGLL